MIKEALEYLNIWGFSVIPLKLNKKPFSNLLPKDEKGKPVWEPFQTRRATEEEITRWWTEEPTALIGIVTGKISGIAVLDIDTKEMPIELIGCDAPVAETPRGHHFYFKYQDGITNATKVGGREIDIRGEGGYVVAPPSVNEDGKAYKWLVLLKTDLPPFPEEFKETSIKGITGIGAPREFPRGIDPQSPITSLESFDDGRRDEDLFHVANKLIRAKMPEDQVRNVVMRLALTCNPPFPEKEALTKVQSAINRAYRQDRHWAEEVRAWISVTSGYFSVISCYNELQAVTKEEKAAVRAELFRLKGTDILEPQPNKNGWYRLIEKECEAIDWEEAPENDIPIWLPFDLHKLTRVYPGNILVVAGWKDAGKTTFLLNFIKENMNKYEIHYFNSEMGKTELKLRLKLFKDMKISDWNFKAWERKRNFADVIRPDAVNVIDYIEIVEDAWMVGKYLLDIDTKLKRGIAVIALQKPYGRDIARGGESSLDKPRLYLAMNPGQIKIISAKNRRGKENPNGLILDFKLYQGSELYPQGFWRKEEK